MFSKSQKFIQPATALALFIASSLPLHAQMHTLTITEQAGGVVRAGTNIACGTEDRYGSRLPQTTSVHNTCTHSYAANTTVNLRAIPNHGYAFVGWVGSCSGESSQLTLTMSSALTCRAAFAKLSGYIQMDIVKLIRQNTSEPVHACALVSNGTTHCWGANNLGQLGDGTVTTRTTPVTVAGIRNAIAISVGRDYSCAALSSGQVRCWGSNGMGQLGDGTTENRLTPVAVSGINNAVSISAGIFYACALLSNGRASCWGNNSNGQLGNGNTDNSHTPVAVMNISNAVDIAAGFAHSCAVLSNGQAHCWGSNIIGELGSGAPANPSQTTPLTVSGINNAIAVSVGDSHTCAVLSNGQARCWGINSSGQLGDGTATRRNTPVAVSGVTNATSITTGRFHTCAVLSNGQAQCWGLNGNGRLGDGTTQRRNIPATVSGISNATQIAAGRVNSCAVLRNGLAYCWGSSRDGVIGNGVASTTINYSTAQLVSGQTLTPSTIARGGSPNQLFVFLPRVATIGNTWSTSANFPFLHFSSRSGAIYGVPTAVQADTGYTLTATNTSGSTSIALTLGIAHPILFHLKLFLEGTLR